MQMSSEILGPALHLASSEAFLLARQAYAPFALAVAAEAFQGDHIEEIEKTILIKIIAQVKEVFIGNEVLDFDLIHPPEHYLSVWVDNAGSSAWFGIRSGELGETYIRILPRTRALLRLVEEDRRAGKSISASSVDDLEGFVDAAAARLNGSMEDRRAYLEGEITKLELELQNLDRHGMKPLELHEKQAIISNLHRYMNDILQGVSNVPVEMRANHRKYHDWMADQSGKSIGQILEEILADIDKYQSTNINYLSVVKLRRLHISQDKRDILSIKVREVLDACREFVSEGDYRRIDRFFAAVVDTAARINEEQAKFFPRFRALLKRGDISDIQNKLAAARALQNALYEMRDRAEPTISDIRLRDVGLSLPIPIHPRLPKGLSREIPKVHDVPDSVPVLRVDDDELKRRKAEIIREMQDKEGRFDLRRIQRDIEALMEGREELPLMEALENLRVRNMSDLICIQEIASSRLPSRIDHDLALGCRLPDEPKNRVAIIPNFVFTKSGSPAVGIGNWQEMFLKTNQIKSVEASGCGRVEIYHLERV